MAAYSDVQVNKVITVMNTFFPLADGYWCCCYFRTGNYAALVGKELSPIYPLHAQCCFCVTRVKLITQEMSFVLIFIMDLLFCFFFQIFLGFTSTMIVNSDQSRTCKIQLHFLLCHTTAPRLLLFPTTKSAGINPFGGGYIVSLCDTHQPNKDTHQPNKDYEVHEVVDCQIRRIPWCMASVSDVQEVNKVVGGCAVINITLYVKEQ